METMLRHWKQKPNTFRLYLLTYILACILVLLNKLPIALLALVPDSCSLSIWHRSRNTFYTKPAFSIFHSHSRSHSITQYLRHILSTMNSHWEKHTHTLWAIQNRVICLIRRTYSLNVIKCNNENTTITFCIRRQRKYKTVWSAKWRC